MVTSDHDEADYPGPSIGTLGEDSLVSGVIDRYPSAPWLTVGPGDDAAVIDLPGHLPGGLIACTDTLVEGQDFRRDWSSARDVGIKVAAQNFADVAAMGGSPHTLLVSLTTPADVPASWAGELADGLAAECTRAGAVVAGGDVSAGSQIVITGTALGSLVRKDAVLRSGARPGDVVAVAGVSGRSAAGWALLRSGMSLPGTSLAGRSLAGTGSMYPASVTDDTSGPTLTALVDDHRRPAPPYRAGVDAALGGASAMIDTSDGLVRDATRIAVASGVTLDLDPAALLPDADLLLAAEFLGGLAAAGAGAARRTAQDWVLTGGEDHALLACFPASARIPASFRVIGTVDAGIPGVLIAGRPFEGTGGWHHWR